MFDAGLDKGRRLVRGLEDRKGRTEDVIVEDALYRAFVDRIRYSSNCKGDKDEESEPTVDSRCPMPWETGNIYARQEDWI